MPSRVDRINIRSVPTPTSSLFWLLADFKLTRENRHIISGQDWHMNIGGGPTAPPFAVKFCEDTNYEHLLAVCDEDGGISICDTTRSGKSSILTSFCAHRNAIFDIEWLPGSMQLLTAGGDQSCQLWDCVSQTRLDVFLGHKGSLKAVCSRKSDPFVFATCARDGSVLVWDRRLSRRGGFIPAVNSIHNAHGILPGTAGSTRTARKLAAGSSPLASSVSAVQGTLKSITSIVFCDENLLVSATASDGAIKIWDLRRIYRGSSRTEPTSYRQFSYAGSSHKRGYSCLTVDSSRTMLFANCIDDVIYQFNCASLSEKPVAVFTGHQNKSFYIRSAVSPKGHFLFSGSSDGKAYIWEVARPECSPWTLDAHADEVTAVAWHPSDMTTIATASDDNTMAVWQLSRAESSADDSCGISGKAIVGRACRARLPQHGLVSQQRRTTAAAVSPSGQTATVAALCRTPSSRGGQSPAAVTPLNVANVAFALREGGRERLCKRAVSAAAPHPAAGSSSSPCTPGRYGLSPATPTSGDCSSSAAAAQQQPGRVVPSWPTTRQLHLQPKPPGGSPRKLFLSPAKGSELPRCSSPSSPALPSLHSGPSASGGCSDVRGSASSAAISTDSAGNRREVSAEHSAALLNVRPGAKRRLCPPECPVDPNAMTAIAADDGSSDAEQGIAYLSPVDRRFASSATAFSASEAADRLAHRPTLSPIRNNVALPVATGCNASSMQASTVARHLCLDLLFESPPSRACDDRTAAAAAVTAAGATSSAAAADEAGEAEAGCTSASVCASPTERTLSPDTSGCNNKENATRLRTPDWLTQYRLRKRRSSPPIAVQGDGGSSSRSRTGSAAAGTASEHVLQAKKKAPMQTRSATVKTLFTKSPAAGRMSSSLTQSPTITSFFTPISPSTGTQS